MAKRQLTALTTDKMTKTIGFSREEYEQRIRALQATAPVMIPIQQIVRRPPFSNLFPINPETYARIVQSIKENGYDQAQAVTLLRYEVDLLLIDGNTRDLAAAEAGLSEIPARILENLTIEEALQYAIRLQRDRRNITDSDIMQFVLNADLAALPGPGKTRDKIASMFGRSPVTIQKFLTVRDKADEETKSRIVRAEETVSRAYDRIVGAPERVTVRLPELPSADPEATEASTPLQDQSEPDTYGAGSPRESRAKTTPAETKRPQPGEKTQAERGADYYILKLRGQLAPLTILALARGLASLGRVKKNELVVIEARLREKKATTRKQ